MMRRYSDLAEMKEALLRLKQAFPDIVLVTDYIIGFPTETDEDFRQTLLYLQELAFSAGMIIPYSRTTGTDASTLEPTVEKHEVLRRIRVAKKFLQTLGYRVLYFPRKEFFIFWNDSYKNE